MENNTNKTIKVLIVDDSAFIRHLLTDMISTEPDLEVVGAASDPFEAREMIKHLSPDILTLDVEMPKMSGIEFLEKIMKLRPMPVIMLSCLTHKGAEVSLQALEMGAFDYIAKPDTLSDEHSWNILKEEITTKIRLAYQSRNRPRRTAGSKNPNKIKYDPNPNIQCDIIAIGASTGGVEAIYELLSEIPDNFPPIVITQHMQKQFTKSFAQRLNTVTKPTVVEAENHMRITSGSVYIAPGGMHLKVIKIGSELVCKILEGEPVSGHMPSVDVLFESVASSFGKNAIGIILTGMGKDGANGLLKMRDSGAKTIGQDKETCVVYGMPQVASSIGAVETELPISEISSYIIKYLSK